MVEASVSVELEPTFCMSCGADECNPDCVTCRAQLLGCSGKATGVFVTRDKLGKLISIHSVWIH